MKQLLSITAACAVLLFTSSTALAASKDKAVPKNKATSLGLYMTAKQAFYANDEEPNTLLIDIRGREELAFVGVAEDIDANVPMFEIDYDKWNGKKSTFGQRYNKQFLDNLEVAIKTAGATYEPYDLKIVLMCRSGKRSAKAVDMLAKRGYTNVYSVVDGFEGDQDKQTGQRTVNGWKNTKLPWSYKIDRDTLASN